MTLEWPEPIVPLPVLRARMFSMRMLPVTLIKKMSPTLPSKSRSCRYTLFALETTSATLPNPTQDLLLTTTLEPLTLNGDDWCGYDRKVPAGGGGGAVVVVVGGAVVVVGA